MEHAPTVTAIEPAELMEFCAEAGYTYRLESHGSLLIPPDYNVGMTDWERSMRLRCVALDDAVSVCGHRVCFSSAFMHPHEFGPLRCSISPRWLCVKRSSHLAF